MVKKSNLWFTGFKRHSGFSKDYTVSKNLEVMAKSTKLKKPANVWLRVGRQAQVLANLSKDKETVNMAKLVATAAFKKLEKIHEREK
jgi:hypothetical protein